MGGRGNRVEREGVNHFDHDFFKKIPSKLEKV